jgi:hypothetical protein
MKITGGCAVAQAVSGRLPTAAVRVRARIKLCRNCGEQSGNRAGFLRVPQFPMALILLLASQSSPSTRAGTIVQQMAAVIVDLALPQLHR